MVHAGRRDAPGFVSGFITVLGVNCTPDCAYLGVAVDGPLEPHAVEYIEAQMLGESSEQLDAVLGEVCGVIGEVDADQVVLPKPASHPRSKRTHATLLVAH